MATKVKYLNKEKTRRINHNYIQIKIDNKWIFEHRKIVEDYIEHKLQDKWVIHHIDFNKLNNSINNLMIFKSQKEHASFHEKIKKYGWTTPVRLQIAYRWKEFK